MRLMIFFLSNNNLFTYLWVRHKIGVDIPNAWSHFTANSAKSTIKISTCKTGELQIVQFHSEIFTFNENFVKVHSNFQKGTVVITVNSTCKIVELQSVQFHSNVFTFNENFVKFHSNFSKRHSS